MRRVVYQALLKAPFRILSTISGIAGFVGSVWPDKVRALIGTVSFPVQPVSIGLLALATIYFLLLWLLKPSELPNGGEGPTQSTVGHGSHAISAGRDVHVYPAPPAHEPKKSNYTLDNLEGLERAIRGGADPDPDYLRKAMAREKADAFARAIYRPQPIIEALSRGLRGELDAEAPYSPILFNGLVEAKDVPHQGYTALRVVIRNQSDENLNGLVATLIRAEPELDGMDGKTHLPLTLATKTRLDAQRNGGEQLPHEGFNLNAGTDKQIEVAWLPSGGVLEGKITHETGEATFLFVQQQELYVEVSGAGRPIVAGVRIEEIDEQTGAWKASLIVEAQGAAHGRGSIGSK